MTNFQKGTFNTISQNQGQFGGHFPVWSRVDKLYQGGGTIDFTGLAPGTVIGAGTMVHFDGPGKQVTIVTADGVAGVKEVDSLVLTQGATTAGNITVTLNGTAKTVAVTAQDNTPEAVATKIAGTAFSGWVVKAEGKTVTFTKADVGTCVAPAFSAGDTGVTGAVEVVTSGADASGNLDKVNGLIFEDVCIPQGCILATCAVAYAGRIYADRVNGGGLPKEIEAKLPMIEFVRED